ncbi:MAG: 3-deoxy-D-manno-octulosonic acid transferase [Bacteroidetes bacterium]|nr:3-deoxy-D-manno-octulosonic acid transferase [Bacteroidota bacterium]
MAQLIYNIFLFLYSAGIRVVALWTPKARKWLEGRRTVLNEIESSGIASTAQKVIWMHCASLGEFEQGRPVLENLKQQYPAAKIVLSFFSPSGYEPIKKFKGADHVFYLPMDNIFAAKRFINAVNPSLVLWVKYEYWYYYLQELKKRNIPVLLVSGIFRKGQPFFAWYGGIWKKMLDCFDHLFVQNEASAQLLNSIGINKNVTVSGDTRFDRVIAIAAQTLDAPLVTTFCSGQKIIVAGSTWEDDEIILAAYTDETKHKEKLIVVPHELDAEHITTIKKMFKQSVCYTELEKNISLQQNLQQYNTLIIDTMGMLSRLYSYGDINYIGGGFTNDGIHNILEAAVWGKPVIIGENYEKYFEAIDLIEAGATESISDAVEMAAVVNHWRNNENAYQESGNAAKQYVYHNAGATGKIMEYIYVNRLLTN